MHLHIHSPRLGFYCNIFNFLTSHDESCSHHCGCKMSPAAGCSELATRLLVSNNHPLLGPSDAQGDHEDGTTANWYCKTRRVVTGWLSSASEVGDALTSLARQGLGKISPWRVCGNRGRTDWSPTGQCPSQRDGTGYTGVETFPGSLSA